MNDALKTIQSFRLFLVILLVALTPLIIHPLLYNSYEPSKIAFIKIMVILLLAIELVYALYGGEIRVALHPINLAIAIYVAWCALSILWAESRSLAVERTIFIVHIAFAALVVQDTLRDNRKHLFMVLWGFLIAGFLTALWVLYDDIIASFFSHLVYFQPKLSDWRGFIGAGFGNTNHIADFLALVFLVNLLFYLYVRGKVKESFVFINALVMAAALIVCWSVGSNLGLIVATILMVILLLMYETKRLWKRRRLRLFVLIAGFVFVACYYMIPHPLNPRREGVFKEAFGSERWQFGLPSRLVIWAGTGEIIRRHLWLGAGAGNFTYAYVQSPSSVLAEDERYMSEIGKYTNGAHNEILEHWANLGLPGVIIFIYMVAMTFKILFDRLRGSTRINLLFRIGAIGLLCAFFLHSMMNFTMRTPYATMLFFLLVSAPLCIADRNRYFASQSFMMPVELDYGPVKLTAFVENMKSIRQLSLRFEMGVLARTLCVAGILLLTVYPVYSAMRPVLSGAHYRNAHDTALVVRPDGTRGFTSSSEKLKAAEEEYIKALEIDPDYHDCRSEYSTMLLEQQRYEEAIEQIRIVLDRLQAWEIHYRIAMAYLNTGEEAKAMEHLLTMFTNRPVNKFIFPELYNRVLTYYSYENSKAHIYLR